MRIQPSHSAIFGIPAIKQANDLAPLVAVKNPANDIKAGILRSLIRNHDLEIINCLIQCRL